ncbi:hypothetical protein IT412_03555 [Candidatus Peregrinibacteria bacterium]|nr:hypothetical protein [Candidatus Peregrinibacteria bacterium]
MIFPIIIKNPRAGPATGVFIDHIRIIKVYGDLGCPCGGTHVKNIQEIGSIKISQTQKRKGHDQG